MAVSSCNDHCGHYWEDGRMMSMNGDNEMNWPEKRANTAETYLFGGNGLLAGLAKLFNSLGVIAQILLASDEDDGKALAEVHDLGNPL